MRYPSLSLCKILSTKPTPNLYRFLSKKVKIKTPYFPHNLGNQNISKIARMISQNPTSDKTALPL